ncbi:hypothetical protein SHI21_10870 [Bacteriovorax sp. PP10]|uniref:Glycosyltransferase RgtA/B/C/D-like domain-containing protein n=1 Tax=Bacteriovorax antarcticus TaxID=3088717 RepID=A0ABU5VUG7_9BACT|nr:hypothetical protein [Bacteriovorax sp. PP10]MEA9356711.1 hypothetical protein [Bacteriovorax sp. PP10]
MKLARPNSLFLIIATVLFSIVSFYYLSKANNLGSNEAAGQLTKKASIIEWEHFPVGSDFKLENLVPDDTFLNYDSKAALGIIENVKSKPSLYYKSSERIYPILLHTRASGIPHYISGQFSRLFPSAIGLIILPWILSIMTFVLALVIVKKSSELTIPFVLVALTTPQLLYFTYPFFPDDYASFAVIILALFIFQKAESKTDFRRIGFLFGLTLYIKLAAVILLPIFFILSFKKVFSNIKYIIQGAIPFLILFIFVTNFQDFFYLLGHEKTLIKPSQFNLDVFKYFALNQFVPGFTFSHIMSLNPTFPTNINKTLLIQGALQAIATVGFIIAFTKPQDIARLIGFIFLFVLGTCVVASGLNEDLLGYMGQGLALLMLVLFIFLDKEKILAKKMLFYTLFGFFFITRIIGFYNWNTEFNKYSHSFNKCVWAYDCMVKDWNESGILKEKQLVTLYYLDIGQIEFFSQEKIKPIHVNWKYSKIPSKENFIGFLSHFPAQEFYILSSKELGIATDLATYLKVSEADVEATLLKNKIKMDIVKHYDYPAISREYTLIKLTKI